MCRPVGAYLSTLFEWLWHKDSACKGRAFYVRNNKRRTVLLVRQVLINKKTIKMRKIESAMCEAVKKRKYWKSGNTEVNVRYDYLGCIHVEVRLFGNLIWKYNEAEDLTEFTLAGWNTNTTRGRLNALGVGVYQKNFSPMYEGEVIDKDKWYKIA